MPLTTATPSPFRAAPTRPVRAPSAMLVALEGRAAWEGLALLAATPWLRRLPRGDGHPVLVFPGMGANDVSTIPLRRFLRRLGYVAEAWGQGFNVGPRHGVLRRCADSVQALADRHGQAVSLVGWSLGGLYARETAKALPDHARCVVTLGTPFAGHPKATNAWRIYELLSGQSADDPAVHDRLRIEPPVPTTSIYSRSDGVVSWRCSLNRPGPNAENIEVLASHLGLGVNPSVLYAVADRLAQPAGRWKPFEARGPARWLYPAPALPHADPAT